MAKKRYYVITETKHTTKRNTFKINKRTDSLREALDVLDRLESKTNATFDWVYMVDTVNQPNVIIPE